MSDYVILSVCLLILIVVLVTVYFVWRAYRLPVVSGREGMIGQVAKVQVQDGVTWIHVEGALWQCESRRPLNDGDMVMIKRIKGLICVVKPVEQEKY